MKKEKLHKGKNKPLETIINLSVENKINATGLVIEYLTYRYHGLNEYTSLKYLDLKYSKDKHIDLYNNK